MKKLVITALTLVFTLLAKGQEDFVKFKVVDGDTIFTIVDEQAHPVNGMASFYEEIKAQMKYPDEARRKKIEGRVFLEFIVNRDGSLSDIKVIRGIGYGCDDESIRVLKVVKSWVPGKVGGRVVRSKFNIAIIFKL